MQHQQPIIYQFICNDEGSTELAQAEICALTKHRHNIRGNKRFKCCILSGTYSHQWTVIILLHLLMSCCVYLRFSLCVVHLCVQPHPGCFCLHGPQRGSCLCTCVYSHVCLTALQSAIWLPAALSFDQPSMLAAVNKQRTAGCRL